jgi:hypothetical protein
MYISNIISQCPSKEGIDFMQKLGISKPSLIEYNIKSLIECDLLISGNKHHLVPEPFNPAFIIQHSQNYCIFRPLEKSQKLIYSCSEIVFFQFGYSNLPSSNDYLFLVSNPMDVVVLDTLGHPALFINSFLKSYPNLLYKLRESFKSIYFLHNSKNSNPKEIETLQKYLSDSLTLIPNINTNQFGISDLASEYLNEIIKNQSITV